MHCRLPVIMAHAAAAAAAAAKKKEQPNSPQSFLEGELQLINILILIPSQIKKFCQPLEESGEGRGSSPLLTASVWILTRPVASDRLSRSQPGWRVKAAHRSVRHGVAVHPHLGIHVDQVPAEGFTLQPLAQGLALRDVADVDPRVLEWHEWWACQSIRSDSLSYFLHLVKFGLLETWWRTFNEYCAGACWAFGKTFPLFNCNLTKCSLVYSCMYLNTGILEWPVCNYYFNQYVSYFLFGTIQTLSTYFNILGPFSKVNNQLFMTF